jgi:hypothetical protein
MNINNKWRGNCKIKRKKGGYYHYYYKAYKMSTQGGKRKRREICPGRYGGFESF